MAFAFIYHLHSGADTKLGKLTRFQPISQAEYEAILSLTDGKTVVSEGRLINGGLAALANLTPGWVTSLRFPNIFGLFGSEQKSPNASYPLCVIRTEEGPGSEHYHEQHNHHSHHEHRNRQRRSDDNDSHENLEHDYHQYHYQYLQHQGDHSNEDHSGEYDSSIETLWNTNKLGPVVNCIVVLREDDHHNHDGDDGHGDDDHNHYHHTATKRPRRKRRKHTPHQVLLPVPPPSPPSYQPVLTYPPPYQAPPPPPPPPSPATAYPYSAAQNPYSVAPPSPHGSYNNPWYWQTPHYHPYYSEPTTFTDIYPAAYPDIYATSNPSPYTRNYPGTYISAFASSPPSNNPGPYYDTPPSPYSDPPASAYPSNSHDSHPSSYTSHYTNTKFSLNRKNPRPNYESNYNYGPPPNVGSFEATGQENYSQQYDEGIKESHNASSKSKQSTSASKVPTRSKKQKSKPTSKSRSPSDHIDNVSTSNKEPIRQRHTKVKRDESGIQTRSYAKIASYSESGYQPSLYPQSNYQSNYPKVSYTHSLPYPAPVYVRNNIEQSTTMTNTKQYRAYSADAENEDLLPDYIQGRRQHEGYIK